MTILRHHQTKRARRGFVRISIALAPLLLAMVPISDDLPRFGATVHARFDDAGFSGGGSRVRTELEAVNTYGIEAAWLEGDSHYGPMSTPAPAGIETSPLVRMFASSERSGPSVSSR